MPMSEFSPVSTPVSMFSNSVVRTGNATIKAFGNFSVSVSMNNTSGITSTNALARAGEAANVYHLTDADGDGRSAPLNRKKRHIKSKTGKKFGISLFSDETEVDAPMREESSDSDDHRNSRRSSQSTFQIARRIGIAARLYSAID